MAECEAAGTVSIGWDSAIYSIAPALDAKGAGIVTAAKLNVLGSAAAYWFMHCSRQLYAASEQGKPTGRWGTGQYSKERWVKWKQRLENLQEQDGMWEQTRVLAKKATAAMREAERADL